jgi:hypothetical protein
VNALRRLTGMGAVEVLFGATGCSECDQLWREYQYAARSYASMMHAQHVFANEPVQLHEVSEAVQSASLVWSKARAALVAHASLHGQDLSGTESAAKAANGNQLAHWPLVSHQ